VNGDGIDDVVVYSTYFQIPKYVVFGTSDNQLDDISVSSLTPNIGFEIQHSDSSAVLTCSALGDINGDGYDDFMIGDIKYNGNRGAVYVIYGRSSFPSILYISTLPSIERLVISGSKINDYFGKYLSWKPGIKSGCCDILTCSSSRCYVIPCIQPVETGINVDDMIFNSMNGYTVQVTLISSMKYTMIISSIGDVNGDGLSDFAMSSSSYFSGRGVVYVIFGTHYNSNVNIDLDAMDTSMGITITHSRSGAGVGSAVSGAGDVNGDGVDDILIGSIAVEAFVIYGDVNMTNIDLKTTPLSQGYSISSSLSRSSVDFRVVGNIDMNHDGISDIAIGCPYDEMVERVYVIFGINNRYRSNVVLEYMTSAQGLVIETSDLGDKSGYYISSSGDFNNDTFRDLLISATFALNKVGAAYIITNAFSSNTHAPTSIPNNLPKPSKRPSLFPSVKPTTMPSVKPTIVLTVKPIKSSTVPPQFIASESPSCNPSIASSTTMDTTEPSGDNSIASCSPTHKPSRNPNLNRPSLRPSRYLSQQPSTQPISVIYSLPPVQGKTSVSPSFSPHLSSNETNSSTTFAKLQNIGDNSLIKVVTVSIWMFASVILLVFIFNFRYIYKFVMDKVGHDVSKPIISKEVHVNLRVASLEECYEHFWKYRGIIYKQGSITDDLFTRFGCPKSSNYQRKVLNALHHISANPNILCPMSYYKVVCHMADKPNDELRNKSYETLLMCKSVMIKCVTVESIQLLTRMFLDSGGPNVKVHAATILSEISNSNPNLITFDIYNMLRTYKDNSDTILLHAVEMAVLEIKHHCTHLHVQIEEYENMLQTTRYRNDEESCCQSSKVVALENKSNEVVVAAQTTLPNTSFDNNGSVDEMLILSENCYGTNLGNNESIGQAESDDFDDGSWDDTMITEYLQDYYGRPVEVKDKN
jgi:hypothetical protein